MCAGTLVAAATADAAPRSHLRAQIIGAQPVPPGALEQLAYVQDQVSTSSYIGCTGTVVSSNLVLTAGHCAQDDATGTARPASGFLVVTGRPNLANQASGQISTVSRVLPYPGYNPATHRGDAALLELSNPTTAPAIRLADAGQSTLWKPLTNVAIAGWGLTHGSGGGPPPTQAQWAITVTQSADYCAANALLALTPFDPAGQICAVDAPTFATGTCLGDSGGPMLADYDSAGPVEVGITSWGVSTPGTSCSTLFPSFFTQTAPISSWVRSWAQALAPPPAPVPAPPPKPKPDSKPKPSPESKPKAKPRHKSKARSKSKRDPVTTPIARPKAGTYLGTNSQHRGVRLRVTAARDTIRTVRIGYRLHCRGGRRTMHVATFRRLAISDLRFGRRLRAGGATYSLTGTFDTTGAVSGTMKTLRHSAGHGSCRSALRFSARR